MINNQIFCYAFLALLILNLPRPSSTQEVEDESEFDYVEGSDKGPENWGDIHQNWTTCKTGNMQSPIDLMDERVQVATHLGRLERRYKPSNATLINRGHDIQLKWVDYAGSIYIDGTEYHLQQCHWHSPSEHSINGRRFALEAHMVHESLDKRFAVVGIMYTIGRPDTFLSNLMGHIKSTSDSHNHEKESVVGIVDPSNLKMGTLQYYRYLGSLTTPPCTEGVVWTLSKMIGTVSREQVKQLKEAVHDSAANNARPMQVFNGRMVHLYRPTIDSTVD